MELSDEIEISVPMQTVYDALNNVDILKQCIPGCEELVRKSDNQLEAKVVLKAVSYTHLTLPTNREV